MIDNKHKDKRIAKPFVKWAGGKGSLVKQLTEYLPENFEDQVDITYIEPFVGGGAMLFYMLTHHDNIRRAVINDVNKDLIYSYSLIKNNPHALIDLLQKIHDEFHKNDSEEYKTRFYYHMRDRYNNDDFTSDERAACFIFLNKTCFNGLYRVNTKGKFNVPFGKKFNANICDKDLLLIDHELLKKVDIHSGNYGEMVNFISDGYNFLYMDPPYRPLSGSPSFVEYTHKVFDDVEQENLKIYCDLLTEVGCKIMQSNSNSFDNNGEPYFYKLYEGYRIEQIQAHRFINAHVGKREKETELIITNY